MGDSNYQYPVALRWEEGPERLKEMKNKLLLYFQSRRKSNGGECEIRGTECSQGHVLIHFREQTVRDQVLQKETHELTLPGGKTMKLDVRSADNAGSGARTVPATSRMNDVMQPPAAKEPRNDIEYVTQEPPSNLVLIENVQDTCSSEMLNLLMENISEKNEDREFYVELIPEIRSAAITFTCDIDIFSFIQKFSNNHRVKQLKLTASLLEETRSIRAEGLPPNTSEDHIIIYFESSKYGGGKVQETVVLSEEEAALVTFIDVQTAKVILTKKHTFGKRTISVYPYYPSYGIALYGKQRPCIEKPQPLKFPISPYILEFILSNSNLRHSLDKNMGAKNCEITWPDPNCPNPAITLCFPSSLSTHLRTMAKVVRTWNDEVSAEFSLIISKYKVIDCKMNASVWEAITEHVCSSTYEGVLIKPDFAEEKVFLAGTLKDVKKIEPTFRKLVEATTKQVERKNQSSSMPVPVSPALYHIMRNIGLERKILEDVPELKMDYDISAKNIRLIGLREEVLSAKCEILNVRQQLKSKSIQMNPHIIQFLMFADSEELSCLLFVRHNINALFEVEDNAVKLIGHSLKDLTEAEGQIKQELVCRQIPVEEKSILRIPEWRSLHSHLSESFNGERSTVLIEEFPVGAENDVVITGLSTSAQKSYQIIHDFLEKNSPMQKTIQVKSLAVLQFIKEERKHIWDDLNRINVKIAIIKKNILLTGTKLYVEQAASLLQRALSSVCSDTLYIDKPGSKKFCMKNEDIYVTIAKNKFKCLIYLQKDGEEDITAHETSLVDSQFQIKLPNGVTISVYNDDLCYHNVDVIVNASNEDLKHIGGLALAILKAAGPKLQHDCDLIVRNQGQLSAGDSVITDAGNLPCKQVIHTVGPRWDYSSPTRCERLLRRAITSSLELADKNGHKSIAIPAVSSGIFGFPIHSCVQNIVESIKQYMESKHEESSLKNICLVDTNDQTIRAFTNSLKEKFGDQNFDFSPKHRVERPEMKAPKERDSRASATSCQMTTSENVVIKVEEGFIQDATTDVIVNSVGKDLHLDSGGASKALSDRAGKNLQHHLLKASSGSQVEDGSVFVTEGCNLSCNIVIHVVVPAWDGGKGSSEKIFRAIVNNCLSTAERRQLTSITFPAIGTGILGFPRDVAAALLLEEILKFSRKNKIQNIQEVNFMLHPKDTETIKDFSRELTKTKDRYHKEKKKEHNQKNKNVPATSQRAQEGAGAGAGAGPGAGAGAAAGAVAGAASGAGPGAGPAFFGLVQTLTLGVHEMKIGSITYQVKTGDITKEDTDVIVNSTDPTFTLRSGVSKAILDAAGQSVLDECTLLGSQAKTSHIITKNGNLRCKQILHVAGRNSAEGIKEFVTEALNECVKLQASSVAFPAIGTGLASVSSAVVADIILEAVADLAKSKSSRGIQTVKVVIFQQQMLNDFYSSMKKKEGIDLPKQTSFLSKLASSFMSYFTTNGEVEETRDFEFRENIEPAVFHLCAESAEIVEAASSWLRDLILKEQHENIITDEWIQDFDDKDHQTLSEHQKKLGVSVSFKSPGSIIKISGLTRDVLEMSNKLQEMIKNVRDKKTREREAELCSNLVEWRYHDGTKSVPFDHLTNMELEKAKNENKQTLIIDIAGIKYTVIMELKSARDPRGNTLELERIPKHEQFTLPGDWAPMNSDNVKVVPINPGTPEYTDVETQFRKTCQMKIIKIERIQNQHLWINYQIKKQSIDTKTASTTNEKQLFHGTDSSTITTVNHNGFNRSYAGKNAACYGNGTYFAVDSNYSADDHYSKPDANGHKSMYLARVLIGVSCAGKSGMVAPPPKNAANPTDLYDSVTDNPAKPSMYVIFHDIQAYPEYLITFSK
ncbi:protein mono-ADP-ribosyltransferase PARP14-like [Mixophyes fleayi]|uniref:protein mono-ADP-ribosyltransferase PARP14-like n=1 Tax=Mixophyes fleayi TaxID=3061075 RepID=UPI003F4DCA20